MNSKTKTNVKAVKLLSIILIVCLVFCVLASNAFALIYDATVTRVEQAYSNWCWAASSEMIGKKISPSLNRDQYNIATYLLGPNPPNNTATNAAITEALNYACGISTTTYMGTLTFSGCKTYCDNEYPLAIKIRWNIFDNHVVVVDAVDDSNNKLRIVDPGLDCGIEWYEYSLLLTGTNIQSGNNGKYVGTWTVA